MNSLLIMAVIAERRCAMPAPDVQSVIELGTITPVPRTPDYISGITAMRSQSLTVLDCRKAIGFDAAKFPTDHRAIVINHQGDNYALQVDAIEDICEAVSEPGKVSGGFGEQWSHIGSGLVETRLGPALLLNLEALFAGPEALGVAA